VVCVHGLPELLVDSRYHLTYWGRDGSPTYSWDFRHLLLSALDTPVISRSLGSEAV
jgi:hypothetical protein